MPASSVRVPDRVAPPLKPEPAHAEAAIARMVDGEPYRRGVLAGLTVVTLAAAFPALAGEAHPDAELLELERRRVAELQAKEIASTRWDAISDKTVLPGPPEALFLQESDEALGIARLARRRWCGRMWYSVGSPGDGWPVEALRRPRTRRQIRVPDPEEGYPDYVHEIENVVPWPEAQARADEIVTAWDDWQARTREIRKTSGLAAAEAEWDRLNDLVSEIEAAIWVAVAYTPAGLLIKARLAQRDFDEENEPPPTLVASLVRDLLAMGQAA